jgi:hypothetical protein
MTDDELVHEDMKLVAKNFLEGNLIKLVRRARYGT